MYLTSSEGSGPNNLLSAKGMSFVTREQIAGLMNVSLHVEAPHPTIPAVTVGQLGGPLLELVEMITKCLRDTGTVLSQNGYPDLGSFVMEALNDAKREGDKIGVAPLAEVVLEKVSHQYSRWAHPTANIGLMHDPYSSSYGLLLLFKTWPW